MSKNVLVVGCGSKFGAKLYQTYKELGYGTYGITGSPTDSKNILQVDWAKCSIEHFEHFLRNLPNIDIVIFNQNSSVTPAKHYTLGSQHIFEVWKQSKSLVQSHYINCVMPVHLVQSLYDSGKILTNTCIAWILSGVVTNFEHGSADYVGQKMQNYIIMNKMSKCNPQIYLGITPGKLDSDKLSSKATTLINFLDNVNHSASGEFFKIDEPDVVRLNVN